MNSVVHNAEMNWSKVLAQKLRHKHPLQDFENTLDDWMAAFHTLLTYNNAALAEAGDKESTLDAVKAAVCRQIFPSPCKKKINIIPN